MKSPTLIVLFFVATISIAVNAKVAIAPTQEQAPPEVEEPLIQTPPATATSSEEAKPEPKPEPEEQGVNLICTSDCPLIDPNNLPPRNKKEEVVEAYQDVPILIAIARCESNFRQFNNEGKPLKNPNSSATGVMQIMASLHEQTARELGYDINETAGNLQYARYLYEKQGTEPWNASRHCWGTLALSPPNPPRVPRWLDGANAQLFSRILFPLSTPPLRSTSPEFRQGSDFVLGARGQGRVVGTFCEQLGKV